MKVLIVDDDTLVCKSLKILLNREEDIDVIGTANDGIEALEFCKNNLPDVILMDIQMPKMNGIQATRQIKASWKEVKIMMLTTFKDEQNIRLAILAGAEGYLIKSTEVANMAQQIRAVHLGYAVMDPDILLQIMKPEENKFKELTPRERDIVELVIEGLSNKEIAKELFLSEGTVRNTLSIVLEKLGMRDRTQLAIYYWKN